MYKTTFVYNEVELECDAMDADFQEAIEKQDDILSEEIDRAVELENTSDSIRAQAQAHKKFFDSLFGEGTSKKMFGDKDNVRITTEAYLSFAGFLGDQRTGFTEKSAEKLIEIGVAEEPEKPNRATRRLNKKK